MHTKKECYQCIKKLTLKTIELSYPSRPNLKQKPARVEKSVLKMLAQQFTKHKVPAVIFTKINRQIKKKTLANDPYKKRKHEEMTIARSISRKILKPYQYNLKKLLLFSAAGNSLDFFKDIHHSAQEMQKQIHFRIDETLKLKKKLRGAKKILFFGDNAGECFFDLPLVRLLAKKAKVIYVVKSQPIQNDLTIADLKNSPIINKFPKIMLSGNDAVGIELSSVSKALKKELQRCDLIIAKGMGYYETFTELPQFRKKVFYILMAKCPPVAKSLGVALNSYVLVNQ